MSFTHCVLFSIGMSIIGSGNKDVLVSITMRVYLITYSTAGPLNSPENMSSQSTSYYE